MTSLNDTPLLCGFSSSLGERKIIQPNTRDGLDEPSCSILNATGLKYFSEVDDLEPHILSSISQTLNLSGIEAKDIDCVLVATKRDGMEKDLEQVIHDAGITKATVIGLDRIACINSVLAMSLANMMVSAGSAENCLVLSCNKMELDEPRLMPPTIGYLSDGAASCVVTKNAVCDGFRLGVNRFQSETELKIDSATEDLLKTFKLVGSSIKGLSQRFYEAAQSTHDDYDLLIMGNYSYSTMRLFSGQLEIPWKMVFRNLVADVSHMSGCDIIVNIGEIENKSPELMDGRTLIFANSATDWIITELVRVKSSY